MEYLDIHFLEIKEVEIHQQKNLRKLGSEKYPLLNVLKFGSQRQRFHLAG